MPCTHLHAHESTALAEVSFGPVRGQLNGAFSICQGLRVLLQAVIAVGTIPKEPTGRNLLMQKGIHVYKNVCPPFVIN